jgi:hypothetical protein
LIQLETGAHPRFAHRWGSDEKDPRFSKARRRERLFDDFLEVDFEFVARDVSLIRRKRSIVRAKADREQAGILDRTLFTNLHPRVFQRTRMPEKSTALRRT